MCLICVEYNKKRMTRTELSRALPEMVMFAKNEEERSHFKKLQSLGEARSVNEEAELEAFTTEHAKLNGKKSS